MNDFIQQSASSSGQPIWILETQSSAYVFGIDSAGYLQHMYWGARLTTASDYGSADDHAEQRPFERSPAVNREEFPAWGDYSYVEPCLKASFADGVRGTVLKYKDSQITSEAGLQTLTILLEDPVYPLSVRLIYRPIPACDLIERRVVIENRGSDAIQLERIMTAAWTFPASEDYRLRALNGKWGGEFQIQETAVGLGKQVLEHRRGASTFDANPWFALGCGSADETQGRVWFGALAFSGNWKMILERSAYGQVTLTGGINDFDFRWLLEAGEVFETPVFVGGFSEAGYGQASRQLHRYQLEHVLAQNTAQSLRPVVYNSWYVTTFDVNEENQVAAAEIAQQLGVEVFIMDDGWFSTRNDDHAGLGDWYVDPVKFPQGLSSMIDRINQLGMKFGIWVEPEMVNPDSDLYRAHPDWVYHFPTRPRSEGRNQLVLNFARQDVQDFAFDFLDKLLDEYTIDYVKWDMNRHFSEPGWPDSPEGRAREIWVRHARGVYEVLRRLREKYPNVMIESCSGGGGRVDMGIMPYIELFWTSDNTDPYDDLFMFEGFTQAYTPLTRMRLVTDPIRLNAERATSLEFAFHVAMMGMLGIGADITQWPQERLDEVQQLVALYKRLRHTLQFGQLYRLRSPRESALSAFQFVSQDGAETIVFVYLHSSRFGNYSAWLQLQGLEAEAMYQLEGAPQVLSGQALMKRGLHLAMSGDFVSRLMIIRRQ